MNIDEFTVDVGGEKLNCALAKPEANRVHDSPALLLNISATRELALHDPGQNHPTAPFLEAGYHVLTFDLPHHGERVGEYGEGLLGMGRAYAAGDDPFEQFVSDGKAALDAALARGLGANPRIVAYGVSRAAYCCLRLAAADSRVRAVAGLAPVTDWALPPEFLEGCPRSKTPPLLIDHWADALADRAVYLCVGAQDDLVGAESCVRFARTLAGKQREALPRDTLYNQLHVVDTPGHSPAKYWRLDATRYLLRFCEQAP